MATLEPCGHRTKLDVDVFLCRHESVFTRNGIVDPSVCRHCSYSHHSGQQAETATDSGGGVRLFVVPATSLRRDPSAWHKRAYASLLARAFGAELVLLEHEESLPIVVEQRKPELLLTMNLPWYDRFSDKSLWQLPRQLPIVTVHDDCRQRMHAGLDVVLDRSAAVISPARTAVLREFPIFAKRLFWLPYFIPNEIHQRSLNHHPKMKCLLTGAVNQSYPMRQRAIRFIPPELLDRLVHPGYWKQDYSRALQGQNYFDVLRSYLAGYTCGSIYRVAVAKYLEIPFSGALLIAEDLPDLPIMGFQPGRHFIAVDEETDLAELVSQIVREPERFEHIRQNGQSLVMQRHTEAARMRDAEQLAERILRLIGLNY